MWKLRIGNVTEVCTFTTVFHRILDFKTGQDFHPALFLLNRRTDEQRMMNVEGREEVELGIRN